MALFILGLETTFLRPTTVLQAWSQLDNLSMKLKTSPVEVYNRRWYNATSKREREMRDAVRSSAQCFALFTKTNTHTHTHTHTLTARASKQVIRSAPTHAHAQNEESERER